MEKAVDPHSRLSDNSCVLSQARGKVGRCKCNQVGKLGKTLRHVFWFLITCAVLHIAKQAVKNIGIENSKPD